MRLGSGKRYLAPLGAVLVLTMTACAAPTSANSGASASLGAPGSSSQLPATSASGAVSSPQLPVTSIGAESSIPSAPGTIGSGAQPSVAPASPVTTAPGVVVTASLPACSPESLVTSTPGRLTFAAPTNPTAPWFVGGPAQGQGYDAAVAAAVAKLLGYAPGEVVWTTADPSAVVSGRAAGFDVAIDQFATPNQLGGPVDYSTGYFSLSDSVVALAGSAASKVTGLAGLTTLRAGAVSGGMNVPADTSKIAGGRTPTIYPSPAAALAALRAGSVDIIVIPTSTAVSAGAGVTVVGQLDDPSEQPQQLGMVLPTKSPLTSCVSAAIDQLRVTGALDKLLRSWIPAADKPLG